MEERSVGGNVLGISNCTNEFANRITINLFKKKINTKSISRGVNVRKSGRNRSDTTVRKNVKLGPRKMFAPSQNSNCERTSLSSINTIHNSNNNQASFDSVQTTNPTSVVDQITSQVTTPFSSSFMNPVSPLRDGSYQSQNLNQVTTVPNLESFETYTSHLQNYQSSQENLNNSTSSPFVSRHTQQTMEPSIQPPIICTSRSSSISNETQNQVLENQNSFKLSSLFQKSLNPCQLRPAKSLLKTQSNSPPSDDLTPLSWLQSLDMGGVVPHLAAPPTPPASPPLGSNVSGTLDKSSREEAPPEKIDYSINGNIKPPYSYAALIGMAMKENGNKMTLSAIYKWIKDHYAYYKTADQSWQNSIRHNLSLNKCFLKVARSKDEPGKGGFWKLDPDYADSLVDGVFKKRRPTKGTPPPTTKCKRSKRPFPYTQQQQIQQQVQKQRQKEQEELQRQREQEDAVRSLLQPVQEAYMPPPTDKPPTMNSIYQQEPMERSLLGEDNVNHLKDDFVWSSFLGDEAVQDDTWQLGTQEVVTDITQSGDPSTYQVTASPTHSITSLSSASSIISNYNHPVLQSQHSSQQHIQTLPSFELSPESLGVEEDLFGTPEYSEASNDEGDSLISSLDLGVGLDLAVDTSNWHNKQTCEVYNIIDHTIKETEVAQQLGSIEQGMMLNVEGSRDLVEFHDFEGNLTQLTALEPVTPVVIQQINQPGWNHEQHSWDEAKTFSLLEANLDFDKLIDLDVM